MRITPKGMICTSIQGRPILGQKWCPMDPCQLHGKLRQLCGATPLTGSTFLGDAAGRMTCISIPGSPTCGKSCHQLVPYLRDEKGMPQCGVMPQMGSMCAEASTLILDMLHGLWIWFSILEPPIRGSSFSLQVPHPNPALNTPWCGVTLMMDSISSEVMPAFSKTMEETGALVKEMICISTQGRLTPGKNCSLPACHTSMDCIGRRLFLHAERSTQRSGANKMTDSTFLEALPAAMTCMMCICIHGKGMNGKLCGPLVPLSLRDINMPSWEMLRVSIPWEGATVQVTPMTICFCTHGRPRLPQQRTHHRRRQPILLPP